MPAQHMIFGITGEVHERAGTEWGGVLWGIVLDGFRPDRFDVIGAGACLLGAAIIAGAPR